MTTRPAADPVALLRAWLERVGEKLTGDEVQAAETWLDQLARTEGAGGDGSAASPGDRPDADRQTEQAARAAMARVAERAEFLSEVSGQLVGVLDPERVWQTAADALPEPVWAAVLMSVDPGAPPTGGGLRVRAVGGTAEARRRLAPQVGSLVAAKPGPGPGIEVPVDRLAVVRQTGDGDVIGRRGEEGASPVVAVPIRAREATLGVMALWLRPDASVREEQLVSRNLAERIGFAIDAAELFQELVRSRRTAEEARALEADFVAMLSHEIRTPLTAIVSYCELLEARARELPGDLAGYVRQVADAAQHQRRLVEQIERLHFRRPTDATAPEEIDFRDAVRLTVAMLRPQAEKKGIQVKAALPDRPVHGRCDPGLLRQVVANLLSNAVRHTQEGEVRVELEDEAETVVLRVADTGEGIPAEFLPRIFDRFWRGPARGREEGRTGLGLTITRELLQRMGGDITVESEPGAGATFTVRVPRAAPTPPARSGGE